MMEELLDQQYEEELKTPDGNTPDLEESLLNDFDPDNLSEGEHAIQVGMMGTYQRVHLQNQLIEMGY